MESRFDRGWRSFAIVVLAFAAIGGVAGAIATVVSYHMLTTRGVRTTAVVDSAWRVKGGWNCSVSFADTGDVQRTETVSGCGSVQKGQAIAVTYDRSDPSTIDPSGSVTAARKLGLATVLALFSALLLFALWARAQARPPRRRQPENGARVNTAPVTLTRWTLSRRNHKGTNSRK